MKYNLTFTEAPVSYFLDWYQISMLQAMTHQLDHNGSIRLRMKYTVRTKGANTARFKEAVRAAIDNFEDRPVFLPTEINKIRQIRYMKPIFVDNLRDMRLHPIDSVEIQEKNGELDITVEGGIQIILFEQVLLAIISELWTQLTFPTEAERLAASKAGIINLRTELIKVRNAAAAHPDKPIRITEAGTRRRALLTHQRDALVALHEEIPNQLFGTSNIGFALEMGLRLVGTQAHLFGMLFQQHGGTLATFPTRAMQAWVNEYRGDLGYMLPDVLTTDAWLKHVDLYFAKLFDGFRWDSGCPHEFTTKVTNHLQSLGVDPANKFAVYGDSLNIDKLLALWKRYEGNPWKTSYLIGTYLTNNIPGHKALSQVIKLNAVNGKAVAKISDEPSKATCDSPEFLAYLKQTFEIA